MDDPVVDSDVTSLRQSPEELVLQDIEVDQKERICLFDSFGDTESICRLKYSINSRSSPVVVGCRKSSVLQAVEGPHHMNRTNFKR